jgi:HSP20 family protein
MALVYRDSFEQLQAEVGRMFEAAFGSPTGWTGAVYPPVDVFDAGDAFVLKAEVPGVEPEKLDVSVEAETVTLRGERAFADPSEGAAFHRRERDQGQFRRVVRLPALVASDEARAEYKNGVLTVRIPKAKEAQPRRLTVQAG